MMRILIKTFPPTTNANYGGILQAWALQQVVRDLGHSAVTDTASARGHLASSATYRAGVDAMKAMLALTGQGRFRQASAARRAAMDAPVLEFARSRMELASSTLPSGQTDRALLAEFDAFVVGSDQVFRPDYARVETFLLDMLPARDRRPRVAYAASFGRADPTGYSTSRARRTRDLATTFRAISVRESSGVGLARRLWGIDAAQMPDPTLLLPPDRYVELSSGMGNRGGGLVTYLLDRNDATLRAVAELATRMGLPTTHLQARRPASSAEYDRDPARYRRPSVEAWLQEIRGADMLVTDSFHGTVFAILFERPFVTIVNAERGAARFETLLSTFGLMDRLFTPGGVHTVASRDINWPSVRSTRDALASLGRDWLRSALTA